MKIKTDEFRIGEGKSVHLDKLPTRIDPVYNSKEQYAELLRDQTEQLCELQELLYASSRYSLLVIFQAMDAAGKDGAIKHVLSGINPQGCQVFSFKQPSAIELSHDFLWRTNNCLPERGRIGVFNRSYYEEVLVVRVHPEFLHAQNIPDELVDPKKIWEGRYRSIRDMENHLYRSGTRILKFYLHLSKDEQRKRFLARIDAPEKNWKFNSGDIEERKHWKEYMSAYEDCMSATSTKEAPWYAVPADDKENARLIISQVMVNALKELKMEYPTLSEAQRTDLQNMRNVLTKKS